MKHSDSDETNLVVFQNEPHYANELAYGQIEKLRAFTINLARYSDELGLLGPEELARIWDRHILNCSVMTPFLTGKRIADIGSGAGLPGLILAITTPNAQFTLIEPMERRVNWLISQVSELDLPNVEVARLRAEDARSLDLFDQVTARAVSSLKKLIPITAPLLKPGGDLLFLKGMSVQQEIDSAKKQISSFRIQDIQVHELGFGILPETTRLFSARTRL